jgi:gamma-glutamylputrescine oxidase
MSISRENIQEHINTPITTGILGGQFIPEQGLVHSAKLVQGIVWAALRRGARAYHAEVFKLESSDNNITLHTSQGNMQAGKVIIATNAWTSKLLPELTNIILPIREQMLAYAPIAPIFTPSIAFDMVEGEYCQQTPDGAILIGGCTFATKTTKKESLGTWDCKPTAMVQNAIERVLPRLFPKLPRLYVTQRWAGLLDYTVDACPIVDQVPDMPGAFVAAGLSGHGMPFGMRFGQLLTKAVQDGTIAPELKPYRLDRPTLKEWRPSMLEELLDYTPNV